MKDNLIIIFFFIIFGMGILFLKSFSNEKKIDGIIELQGKTTNLIVKISENQQSLSNYFLKKDK